MKLSIQRRTLTITAISLVFAIVSVLLLVLRWQVAPPPVTRLHLGDPSTSTAHFYGVEQGSILLSIIALVLGWNTIAGVVVSIIIGGLILYWLFTPAVKAAFGKA